VIGQTLKFKELLALSFRSFRTKPQRVVLTIMGMAIGIATVLLLVSLGYGLQYIIIGKLITTQDSLVTMEITYPTESYNLIKTPYLETLKTYEDVAEISPVAQFPGEISAEDTPKLLIDTKIIEPSYFRLSGTIPDIGKLVENEQGIVVSNQMLFALGLKTDESMLGKLFNLKVYYQDETTNTVDESNSNLEIPVKGIISDETVAPTAIVFANVLSKPPPFYRFILVKAKSVEVLERLRDKLLNEGFLVSARIDLVTQARKITNIITVILGVFGITALIVSAIGMFNTMLVGFLERIYEVGILKSIGATDYDVRNLFLLEASIMGFFGGAGGIFIGFTLGKILNYILSLFAIRFGGISFNLFVSPLWFIGLIMAFSIIIGLLSGWVPAHRAAGLSPKEAFTKR
jgi:ABC-type antimicrobial peptide transport system permease subunit